MHNDQLQKWALAAEIIGGLAVLVTLLVLVFEVRNNTASIRANSAQQIFDSSRQFLLEVALNEELTSISVRGPQGLDNLDEIEYARFRGYMRGNWLFFQNVWIQTSLGVIDERVWATYESIFCGVFGGSPGALELWEREKNQGFDTGFVEYVDSCSMPNN